MVQAQIQQWGDSLALRIPKQVALEIGLEQNAMVTISVKEGKVILEPVKPVYKLNDLLSQITPDNLHLEVGTEPTVGNETW